MIEFPQEFAEATTSDHPSDHGIFLISLMRKFCWYPFRTLLICLRMCRCMFWTLDKNNPSCALKIANIAVSTLSITLPAAAARAPAAIDRYAAPAAVGQYLQLPAPKLDYCNSLYHNLPKSQITRLQTDPDLSCTCCCQSSQIQSHHSHPSVSTLAKDKWAH